MREADVVLFVVDVTVGITEEDAQVADLLRRPATPGAASSPTRSTTSAARPTSGSSRASASAIRCRCRRSTAAARGDLLDALVAALPGADGADDDAASRPTPTGRRRHLLGRDRRPAQRRQVDAVQPARRRRPLGRARHARHDPRRDRHRRRDRRRPAALRRHRRHAAQEPHRRADRVLLASCARCEAIDRADAALLVIDATEGVTHQDQRLAERIDAAGCPVVIVLNKWDLLDAEERGRRAPTEVADQLALPRLRAGAARSRALTGKGVHQLLPALPEADRRATTGGSRPRRSTGCIARRPGRPARAGTAARVLYATQGATDPPTFTLFANRGAAAHLPALPRAQAPRGVRPRPDADQAPRPPPHLVART